MKRWLSFLGSLPARLRGSAVESAVVGLRVRYLPTYHEVQPAIEFELRRARRYERPLTVAVLAPDDNAISEPSENGRNHAAGGDGNGAMGVDGSSHAVWFAAQVNSIQLGEVLHGTTREVDIVGFDAIANRYIVCLPGTDIESARHMVTRTNIMLGDRGRGRLRVGLATFPQDALTLDDLVSHADRRFQQGTDVKSELTVVRKEASA